jgi:hypothetical protein
VNDNAKALYEDLLHSRLPDFAMDKWLTYCGTPQCIGGHAEYRMRGALSSPFADEAEIAQWLGLTARIGRYLFYPNRDMDGVWSHVTSFMGGYAATQPEAAEALRKACELAEEER